jgi:hypothetical protein
MAIKKMELAGREVKTLDLKIECSGDAYDTLVNLLSGIQLACAWGCSRSWSAFFDGDGADHLTIKGLPKVDAKAMFDDALGYGNDIIVGPSSVQSKSIPPEARQIITTKMHWPPERKDETASSADDGSESLVLKDEASGLEARIKRYGERFTAGVYESATGSYVLGIKMTFPTVDAAVAEAKAIIVNQTRLRKL